MLVLPVVLTSVAPLLDYPNHLARIWLLAGGAVHAPLDGIYGVDWSGASTNIGIDLLAATLGRLVGGWALAPLLLGAAILLPPLGAVLLNRAVFGGWHWWQAGFAVLAWNGTLLAGFLNFQLGLGLALLAGAVDPAIVRRAGPFGAALLRMGLGATLLVFHPFAAGFYGVLLAGLAFGAGHGSQEIIEPSFGCRALRAVLAAGLSVGIPVVCFVLLAPTLPGRHAPPGIYDIWAGFTLLNKAMTLMSAIMTYDLRLDLGAILLLWASARLLASAAMLRYHAGLLLGALGLVALALVVPSNLGGTALVDWRFPIMAVLTTTVAIRPGMRSARGSQVMVVALTLLSLVRTGWIAGIWEERQADVAAVEAALAFVPAGSAVLPVEHTGIEGTTSRRGQTLAVGLPLYWHLPSLAVPLRHAFVPTLFTAPGKQPLRVRQPWAKISVLEGVPAPVRYLRTYVPSPRLSYMIGYMAYWRERFDYVLVLNAQVPDADDEASVPELELLADRGFARIYRILRNGTEGLEERAGVHGHMHPAPKPHVD
ncbi:MAG: hypothetical protein ACJ8AW_01575 [Rhodopila sp.]